MVQLREDTHIVIKRDLIHRKLDLQQREQFKELIDCICAYEKPREYLVVNKDEPYACKVLEIILKGEMEKELNG